MNMDIQINSRVGAAIAVVALAAGAVVAYQWWNASESYVSEDNWIATAKFYLEKEPRRKLQSEGKTPSEIDSRIAAMWKAGELKLPEGTAGKDWCATPDGGIRMIPKPEDLLRGANTQFGGATPAGPKGPTNATAR